jgi:hypothetical protein
MKGRTFISLFIVALFILIDFNCLKAQNNAFNFQNGLFGVGFQLFEQYDFSRSILKISDSDSLLSNPRPIRTYVWYPSKENNQQKMLVNDFIELAKGDFCNGTTSNINCAEPVQLLKGFSTTKLNSLKSQKTLSVHNAGFVDQTFPVIVVGQGLYYESPFTHFILCEYLASHGYVVVSCPLMGTQYRLVNLNTVDLETLVRDLEFSLSVALNLPIADKKSIGVIGYDMGGMAGMILSMRNPQVDAFISLDAGILYPHYSGLPKSHPNYSLSNLTIPWMHVTQARFCPGGFEKSHPLNTMKQKVFGNNYLLLLNTTNHGAFTSYAMLGIENQVPGYWENDYSDIAPFYEKVCTYSLKFLNAYLKNDKDSKKSISEKSGNQGNNESFDIIGNRDLTFSKNQIINKIIIDGAQVGISAFYKIDKEFQDKVFADENELNWLGYHFLYWWDRSTEAIQVFEFITELFPKSANAFDSLGESYLNSGNKEKAIKYYQKSLELNPDNENAKQMIDRLNKNQFK